MDAEVTHDVKISEHGGYKFFNLTNIHVKFDIEGLKMRLNNLFNGVKALGERLQNDHLSVKMCTN